MTILVYYFVICTMSGIRSLGVRFCCLKMYKVSPLPWYFFILFFCKPTKRCFQIRPQRTVPQGILFTCMLLMFSMLALNILLITLMPTYISYGNQRYSDLALPANNVRLFSLFIWF